MILLSMANKVLDKLLIWREIYLERRHLGEISDEQLRDVGISKADAVHEAHRPFWDTSRVEDTPRPHKPRRR